ncbi:unnamed protein product [Didymodactylos carnosus]|uniref:Apolipoprotein D n=1 Tax=Didymodactylos carnosus TaxID=1234261 RepID=A0A815VJI3_9BILA|nr:unnamed protein product [Didymodactylos carnosus]CAF1531250.1 unnamed protein product [Didymodactylos carnosus]CAF3858496.1 unnamed protein product [Didymodactylos carnosus]CAF4390519.1 unnamed protein product [Didymodactylos carnosus]
MYFIILFVSLFISSFAAECPKFKTQSAFDVTKYGGLWYEIERSDIIFELGSRCVNATYTLNPNGTVDVFNQEINLMGEYTSIHGTATVKDPKVPAAFVVQFNSGIKGDYNVISTDYINYSLVYACESILGLKVEFIWILSREKTLSDSIINELQTILKNFGADISQLKPTVQKNC